MIFDQATDSQIQAARIFSGITMAGIVAAPFFRRHASFVRSVLAAVYILGVVGAIIYFLI